MKILKSELKELIRKVLKENNISFKGLPLLNNGKPVYTSHTPKYSDPKSGEDFMEGFEQTPYGIRLKNTIKNLVKEAIRK